MYSITVNELQLLVFVVICSRTFTLFLGDIDVTAIKMAAEIDYRFKVIKCSILRWYLLIVHQFFTYVNYTSFKSLQVFAFHIRNTKRLVKYAQPLRVFILYIWYRACHTFNKWILVCAFRARVVSLSEIEVPHMPPIWPSPDMSPFWPELETQPLSATLFPVSDKYC